MTVVLDPFALLRSVEDALVDYLAGLKKPPCIKGRKRFKRKFEESFGITIGEVS